VVEQDDLIVHDEDMVYMMLIDDRNPRNIQLIIQSKHYRYYEHHQNKHLSTVLDFVQIDDLMQLEMMVSFFYR
jgi:hypothetical protein